MEIRQTSLEIEGGLDVSGGAYGQLLVVADSMGSRGLMPAISIG